MTSRNRAATKEPQCPSSTPSSKKSSPPTASSHTRAWWTRSAMSARAIPTIRNHFLLSRARAPDCIEKDDIMEFTLEGEPVNPRRASAPYLERFIHGGALRGAAGRALGGAQPLAERDPVRRHRQARSSRSCTCAPISATRCRPGIRTTSSATPRCWSRAWPWAATSPRRMGTRPHHPDARPRRDRGRAQHPPRRVHLDLSRGQRQAADAGDGDGRHQVPHRRRGRQDHRAHRPLHAQPRLGELVPPRRPAGDAQAA